MNDTNDNTQATAVFDAPKGDFEPELAYYHANGKNTGVAIRFRVEPATADRDGTVFFAKHFSFTSVPPCCCRSVLMLIQGIGR